MAASRSSSGSATASCSCSWALGMIGQRRTPRYGVRMKVYLTLCHDRTLAWVAGRVLLLANTDRQAGLRVRVRRGPPRPAQTPLPRTACLSVAPC